MCIVIRSNFFSEREKIKAGWVIVKNRKPKVTFLLFLCFWLHQNSGEVSIQCLSIFLLEMSSGITYPKMGSKAQLWRLLIGFEWAMWEGTLNTCLFQLRINRFSPFSLLRWQKMKHYPINYRNFPGAKLYRLDEAEWSLLIERETQEGKRRRESAENNGERASHANAGFRQVRVPCAPWSLQSCPEDRNEEI